MAECLFDSATRPGPRRYPRGRRFGSGAGREEGRHHRVLYGGRLSYLAATNEVDIQASVPFYGGGIDGILADAHCPLLAFFGGNDEYVPMTAIEKVRARHGDDVVVYADAQHGFMRDGSPEYHATAAPDAWQRALDFFATHLK